MKKELDFLFHFRLFIHYNFYFVNIYLTFSLTYAIIIKTFNVAIQTTHEGILPVFLTICNVPLYLVAFTCFP